MTDTAGRETEAAPVEHVVAMLRERLYGAISCLATLVVLSRYTAEEGTAWILMVDVAVTMGGLWAASLLADFVAHLAVHEQAPSRADRWRVLQASGQILQAAVLPLAALAFAGIGVLDTATAMWVAMWILVGELGLIALLAVRRTRLPWWQQIVTIAALIVIGLLVIAVKVLTH